MTSVGLRPAFMTGLHYLDHQQIKGEPHGAMRMLNRRFEFGKNLYSKDLFAHFGCVNAIEFSNDGEWLVSGGDDKRVLIWNIDKTLSNSRHPKVMKGEHNSNIFCLGFSHSNTKLFSAGNDEQVILHDVTTGEIMDVFLHDEAVYGLSVDPVNENVFASACDDGRILIWDVRSVSNEPFTLDTCSSAYHAVMYNPVEPRFLATANAKDGVCLWDIRKPKEHYIKYGPTLLSQSAMSVRFNSAGTHLLALRRRFPPVLYEIASTQPTAEFDHNEYYNSCTMKSCCFAGDQDQFILSGSDDFKLYVWKIPDSVQTKKGMMVKKAHFILRGHRSIVNQVRYNSTYGMLASSGVEKIVKLWSSFPLSYQDDSNNYVSSKDNLRKVYSHEEYVNLVLESGQFMTHDYSHHSVKEDPRMMAFFDSLVQRDIEGWTSDSSDATEAMKINTCYVVQSADSMSSSLSSSSSDENDEEKTPIISVDGGRVRGSGTDTSRDELSASRLAMAWARKRALATEQQERSPDEVEENLDQSLDRISMLIAQKRKEQMLKAQRASLQLGKKNGKMGKKKSKDPSASSSKSHGPGDGSGLSREKLLLSDKRKLLRKRRARLNKVSLLDPRSSDSDAESTKGAEDETARNEKKIEDSGGSSGAIPDDTEPTNETSLNPSDNLSALPFHTSGNYNFVAGPSNINIERIGDIGINVTGDMNVSLLSNIASTSVNGMESLNGVSNAFGGTENSLPVDSKNVTFFSTKGVKRNSRNYRKRGADELDD